MTNRKPNPHNQPFEVTPENEQAFIEQCQTEDESAAAALENLYAQQEWDREQHEQAREAFQRSQGIIK